MNVKTKVIIGSSAIIATVIGFYLGRYIYNEVQKRRKELEDLEYTQLDFLKTAINESLETNELHDYTKFVNLKPKEDLSNLVKPYTSQTKPDPDESDSGIKIISSDEYTDDLAYDKQVITYYASDMTFADSQEVMIDDVNGLFGANIHLHFGEKNDDPDIVYVRNEGLGVDYEISQIRGSYKVVVLGQLDEVKPEKRRKKGKKGDLLNIEDDTEDDEI